jgi:hypothetical protein
MLVLALAGLVVWGVNASPYWARSVKFRWFAVEFSVPEGWKIIDPSCVKTDNLADPVQLQADDLLNAGLDRCCVLQRRGPGGVKPTICLVPGEGFIQTAPAPADGSLKQGTAATASIFAAQLAGLAISPDMVADLPSQVNVTRGTFAGHKVFQAQISGKSLVLWGISVKLGAKAAPVTLGLAASPETLDEAKRAAEEIVQQIDGKANSGHSPEPSPARRNAQE